MKELLEVIDKLAESADNTGCSEDLTVVSAGALAELNELVRQHRMCV
jgi:hypothetical protein